MHALFDGARCMLRVFKHYITRFEHVDVAASAVSFSSRPGAHILAYVSM